MNINFELYRIFYVVANNSNITKASIELNISQPAVSKSIKKLEEELGGDLFIRTKRGVILTEEGIEFYKYIKEAMDYIYNAENKFKDLINLDIGNIRIGISSTLTREFLLPYLKIFHERYPNISVEISTNISIELIERLKNGLLDIVIYNLSNHLDKELNIIKCMEVHDCFIYSPILKINNNIKLEDLNKYPLILQPKSNNTRKLLDDYMLTKNITLKPSMELASYNLVVDFTKIGFGIGYATKEYIKKELDEGSLIELNINEKLPTKEIAIATSRHHLPNFSSKKLIEIITKKR